MAIYLQVRAGPLSILLDALRVHEVVLLGQSLREDQAFAQWRDQVLCVVRLAQHLQLSGSQGHQAVIYSPGQGLPPAMLIVDEVLRLRHMEPSHWSAMPTVPARTSALFDAVFWDESSSQQVFRLRSEVAPALLGISEPEDADLSAEAPR